MDDMGGGIGEIRHTTFCTKNLKRRYQMAELFINGRIILELFVKEMLYENVNCI
jgi:hypothetical protein